MAGMGVILAGCATDVEVREPARVYVAPAPVIVAPSPVVVETPPPVVVEPAAPAAEIAITSDADFEEPLRAYGRWDMVAGVGRCWIPNQVDADWRPYTRGHWERTDAGWYWASDESWGWATYHYGRWGWQPESGWYWSPGVHWAPAWVSWRNGGGYAGWAPLPPAARFHEGAGIEFDVNLIPPRSFVFVEERNFTEPIRPTTVIVNNTTIVNKTVNITNIRVVNKTIINEGPTTQRIEEATGHPVRMVRAVELRHQIEARVAIKPVPAAPRREPPLGQQRPQPIAKPTIRPVEERPQQVQRPAVTPPVAASREETPRPINRPAPEAADRRVQADAVAERANKEPRPKLTPEEQRAAKLKAAKENQKRAGPKPPTHRPGGTNEVQGRPGP